ncbi:MAG TPA: hypothetical protein VM364_08175 [Vicinamibacterales bacterium]|nr:hypothetical protein [Vicinamibacterales bacterium]
MKTLFKLAIALLVVHALVRFVPPYWNFTQFRSALKERATEWHQQSDAGVVQEVVNLAAHFDVPITAENVRVRRDVDHLYIDVSYKAPIEFIPGSKHDWKFDASIDAWTLKPPVIPRAP